MHMQLYKRNNATLPLLAERTANESPRLLNTLFGAFELVVVLGANIPFRDATGSVSGENP